MVVEPKSIDKFHPIHDEQLLTYLRLLESPKGILYNFSIVNLYGDGQRTLVNEIFKALSD